MSFQKKKKIKELRPKMTKIASRGSCLKTRSKAGMPVNHALYRQTYLDTVRRECCTESIKISLLKFKFENHLTKWKKGSVGLLEK